MKNFFNFVFSIVSLGKRWKQVGPWERLAWRGLPFIALGAILVYFIFR